MNWKNQGCRKAVAWKLSKDKSCLFLQYHCGFAVEVLGAGGGGTVCILINIACHPYCKHVYRPTAKELQN